MADQCGWSSDLPTFSGTQPRVIRLRLESFVREVDPSQLRAWDQSIPFLQRECREVVSSEDRARTFTAILEYQLPLEARRPDVIVLENGAVVVLELKGTSGPTAAALDQVHAYARDLRSYHEECHARVVIPVLVPTQMRATETERDGVIVASPDRIHSVLLAMARQHPGAPLSAESFMRADAYAPLPSLITAARALFINKELPRIKRARAATDPAVESIARIAHEAAKTKTRRLVLVTGLPGAGKTLVGLRAVHSGYLDDLAVERSQGRRASPAVFLSGNGPLVQVLQDALKGAGGDGKTFVRDVKGYVSYYSRKEGSVPPEHMLVFDEAQRAWDADQVARKHADAASHGKSEPEHFVEFAERIPDWCVVVGLIGTGQEIHVGEWGGLEQWRRAIEGCARPQSWVVHAPADLERAFENSAVRSAWEPSLSLDTEIRFHLAPRLHRFVDGLLEGEAAEVLQAISSELGEAGVRLRVTRSLDLAKRYARERYGDDPEARFGLLASSKDKDLLGFGVDNSYMGTKNLRVGSWYNAPPSDIRSCRQLDAVATEFSSQGLELDLALLCWGSDFARVDGSWTVERSGRTRHHKDTYSLRRNVYRVLLTRGRDGTVVFVPPSAWLDETHAYLLAAGFRPVELEQAGS